MIMRRGLVSALAGLLLLLSHGMGIAETHPREVTVFAAASLKTALDEVAAAWSRASGEPMPSQAKQHRIVARRRRGNIAVTARCGTTNAPHAGAPPAPDDGIHAMTRAIVLGEHRMAVARSMPGTRSARYWQRRQGPNPIARGSLQCPHMTKGGRR